MLIPKLPGVAAKLIGQKVSARRSHSGLSAEDVARVLGMSVQTLEAAERGEIDFTPTQVYELSSILRVTPSWFFEDLSDQPG